jgi:hypothetical protein
MTASVAQAIKKSRGATKAAQTGRSRRFKRIRKYHLRVTTPSAPLKEASRYFLDVASTPPSQGGEFAAY